MIIALSMTIPTLLFLCGWLALLIILDPIGRQSPSRSHPTQRIIDQHPPSLDLDTDTTVIKLLHQSRTLSAIELYMTLHNVPFEDAKISVLKLEATLWD